MTSTIVFVGLSSYCIYFIASYIKALRQNIAKAKASGLPYHVSPINTHHILWFLTYKIWMPIIHALPKSWTKEWLFFASPGWIWRNQFEPFRDNDIFLTVSSSSIHVLVGNAEVVQQVTARRDAFTKPLESYRILDIFGRNVVTTEGAVWKAHRKITAPGFNEHNNALAFEESCRQAQGMLKKWTGEDGTGNTTITEVPNDTMRVALHIISRIGFGVRLLWPGENPPDKDDCTTYSSSDLPEGHSMSFAGALEGLLEQLIWILLLPKWLLRWLPFKGAQKAHSCFMNWSQYMNELFDQKVEEARNSNDTQEEGMDIMGSLVRSSYGREGRKTSDGGPDQTDAVLSDSNILGNAFVMLLAGHETTANSIHFSLVELATNPKSQRLVQKEVTAIFGNTPPEEWNYESSINSLLGGIIGAVLNEQLRLMAPIVSIPKRVTKDKDQTITIEGKQYTLPAGSRVGLVTVAAHRNPKYWPTQPSLVSDRSHDLYDFRPERWLVKTAEDSSQPANNALHSDEEDFGGFTGQDTSVHLFRPTKGSYFPFSEGARSCLGRRLAQVEVMAVLAVIFQNYSIELAVDEWATDEEVAAMTAEEKKKVYAQAQEKARATLRSATTRITLKLHPGFVPVRLVRKGEERFVNLIDDDDETK